MTLQEAIRRYCKSQGLTDPLDRKYIQVEKAFRAGCYYAARFHAEQITHIKEEGN